MMVPNNTSNLLDGEHHESFFPQVTHKVVTINEHNGNNNDKIPFYHALYWRRSNSKPGVFITI